MLPSEHWFVRLIPSVVSCLLSVAAVMVSALTVLFCSQGLSSVSSLSAMDPDGISVKLATDTGENTFLPLRMLQGS